MGGEWIIRTRILYSRVQSLSLASSECPNGLDALVPGIIILTTYASSHRHLHRGDDEEEVRRSLNSPANVSASDAFARTSLAKALLRSLSSEDLALHPEGER